MPKDDQKSYMKRRLEAEAERRGISVSALLLSFDHDHENRQPEAMDPDFARVLRAAGADPETWYDGHSPDCSFGGLWSCLYWLAAEGCTADHPNVHVHAPGEACPLQ